MISLRKVGAGGTVPHAQTHPVRSVHILKPHHVILAQIAARLHLEHFQRYLAGIFQSILRAEGDKSGFVLTGQESLVTARHLGRALDYNPLFCPMVVHLQRQCSAGLDGDALHLKTSPGVNALVPAPGLASLSPTSHRADQAPMSFQRMSAGTTSALRGAGGADVGEECGADGGGA